MAHNGQLFESHAAAATAGVKLHRGWAHVNWQVAGWGCCWLSQAKNLNAFGYPWLYTSNYINTCLNNLESSFNFVLSNLFFFTFPSEGFFPPEEQNVLSQLSKCLRVLPHQNDTGGFLAFWKAGIVRRDAGLVNSLALL